MKYIQKLNEFCSIYVIICRLIAIFELFITDIKCIRLTEVNIPNYIVRDKNAKLECKYNLDGEELYSVKWYKDGNEFYRYVPRELPPTQVFRLPGINVDLENSTDTTVVLLSLSLTSTGRYRCEISGEAPKFQSVTEYSDLIVVALPEKGPRITGAKPRYKIGDTVRVNCTSGRSKPAAQLKWFINGELADLHLLHGPEIIITGREGLETAILGLEFRVRQKHFKHGDLKIKCLATIATIYWRSKEETIETILTESRKVPALESKVTGYPPSDSHVHNIQASIGHKSSKKIPFTMLVIISYGLIIFSTTYLSTILMIMTTMTTILFFLNVEQNNLIIR